MVILVTGGAGYIGSHICLELLRNNHHVIILDDLSNSRIETIFQIEEVSGKDLKFYQLSIVDREGLKNIFEENKIDAVIHLAGFKYSEESLNDPIMYYNNNVSGTITLLDTMKKHEVKKIICSSSATVYCKDSLPPINESSKINPMTPYGRTKQFIEQVIEDLCLSDKSWSAVLLRYFNPVGASSLGVIGENAKKLPTNLMPHIIRVALGLTNELKIYGDSYLTPDGTCIRDYIHIDDLAKGHVKALDYVINNGRFDTINLGTGRGCSVLDLVRCFEKVNNIDIPYRFVSKREGDIPISYADVTKAWEILKWKSEKNINDMCRDSFKYGQKFFKKDCDFKEII